MWHSRECLSMDKCRELYLFRNDCGSQVDFPGNKGAWRSNAPGPQRRQSGTIPAIFSGWWNALNADCPIFTKIRG